MIQEASVDNYKTEMYNNLQIHPDFTEKVNNFSNVDKIKNDFKKDRAERVWN